MFTASAINKLIHNLVAIPNGVEIEFSELPNVPIYNDAKYYNVNIVYDPEKYLTIGREFDEEYAMNLWNIEDEIDSALSYFGKDDIVINSITFEPTSNDLFNKVSQFIMDNKDAIENELQDKFREYVKIEGVSAGVDDGRRDPYLDVSLNIEEPDNLSEFEMNFWSIVSQYVDTDSFIHNIRYN